MEKTKSVHKVICTKIKPHQSGESEDKSLKMKKAVLGIIEDISIENGSFKIFVHNGNPGERIEIQNKVLMNI